MQILLFLLIVCICKVDASVIDTLNGPVQGFTTATANVFLGIPFAPAPVGQLRWKSPQPHQNWVITYLLGMSI